MIAPQWHGSHACCRAYNEWSAAYCAQAPERLRWAAMLPLQEPSLAIEEAERAAAAGAVSYYIRPNPVKGRHLGHEDYHTDYPHPDGTWPWGIERLASQPISEQSKRKILWDNPARAFALRS